MMTLPAALAAKLKSNDLRGINPLVWLYRNKWDAQTNTFAPETTPIDITEQVIKCGTLSTKLDVGEINEYTASNVTLTISDPQNHFVEGTPKSYFPDGYQIYGSRIELYAGTDTNNMTPLFYGVIRSLPNHKPEEYQLDISVVSALEVLDDVEAKDFSTPYTGETLTLDHRDDDAGPVYRTANTGVGGFNAVYANGSVLVEGVDYEVSQLSENTLPALVEIINESYFSSTITADYYVWKKNLAVEDIVKGLLEMASIGPANYDVSDVVWKASVRGQEDVSVCASLGYDLQGGFLEKRDELNIGSMLNNSSSARSKNIFPDDFVLEESFNLGADRKNYGVSGRLFYGTFDDNLNPQNGFSLEILFTERNIFYTWFFVYGSIFVNGQEQQRTNFFQNSGISVVEMPLKITRQNNTLNVEVSGVSKTFSLPSNFNFGNSENWNCFFKTGGFSAIKNSIKITLPNYSSSVINTSGVLFENINKVERSWEYLQGAPSNDNARYDLKYRLKSNDNFSNWTNYNFGEPLGVETDDIQFLLNITEGDANFNNVVLEYLSSKLVMQVVNLTDQSVLEVIEDLALITGYEFGIDRNNVFFFRPRQTSTQPVAVLDELELVKIDTVTRNFNELATKLTLTFAAAPLEFYANTGARPTPVDKYGVIEKEIDKPQLINYDNPELAQAIGPQLLAIYSELPNIITCTGKLNLALELGDIVNLKREMPLTINPEASDYTKYEGLNTFYRACKITGLNYDFTKRQIKYTLRDVSNANNAPVKDYYEYQTIFPTPLDYKE